MTIGTKILASGFIGRVPVRNIWLLLLYASQLYRELPASRRIELENAPDDIPFLVAEILANAVEKRLRRNLSHGYLRRSADLNRVRGRINLFRTERRQLLRRGSVACAFDELTVDTPRNRYIKAALGHIASVVSQSPKHSDLYRRCRDLAFRLERTGVLGYLDTRRARQFRMLDNTGWVDAHERQMLGAAKLALNLSIPTEQSGLAQLPVVNRSETTGWKLYEHAVAGFYEVALSHQGWTVKHGSHLDWPVSDPTPDVRSIMPRMIPDIILEQRSLGMPTDGQRIVIDTKFTSIISRSQYGKATFNSANIYQLYAYLRSQERPDDPMSCGSTGVLLYPSLGRGYCESAIIQGHRVLFATVDLTEDTQKIRSQLLRIVDS